MGLWRQLGGVGERRKWNVGFTRVPSIWLEVFFHIGNCKYMAADSTATVVQYVADSIQDTAVNILCFQTPREAQNCLFFFFLFFEHSSLLWLVEGNMFRISLKIKSKQNRLIGFSLGAKEDERRMGILFSYQYRTQNSSTAGGPVCVTLANKIRRWFEFFLLSTFTNCLQRFNVM